MENKKTSVAFIAASWIGLILGVGGYLIGLWRAEMQLNEKGYYLLVILYGLFSAVSIQKSVRDKLDNIPVTDIYYGLCWTSLLISIALLAIGLYNAELLPSEKGFYVFGFILSLFGAICVQKNTRDLNDEKGMFNKKPVPSQTEKED